MRIPQTIFALVLCAATASAVHAQTATSEFTRATGPTKAPSGMSFSYDAQHGQITATGVQMNTVAKKPSAVTPTSGLIDLTINIKIVSRFESGTTYHCSVYAIGGLINTDTGTVDGGIENANGFATVTAPGMATCRIKIPYEWTLAGQGDTGLILAYGVGAINVHSEVEHSTLQVNGIDNLPANGTTSKFVFNVAL